ncbi:zinc finger CCHC domain-containing protein 7-like [Salarias fasciatus]|uniref:zinc finger CCHC domain-containing protein 7-like n=1 Tax=Salarias fasciatus TaxID=181472 RepID=UPI0011768E61|nr:zinc finger CCHC domain-containing protein 7-like [Salarias fasciatus]
MDQTEGNEGDGGGVDGAKNKFYFIEDPDSSESEGEMWPNQHKPGGSCKRDPRQSKEGSPPLVLVYSRSQEQRAQQDCSLSASADLQEERDEEPGEELEEDSDQPIEDWMILDDVKREEDSDIQLNLSYWNSSDDASGDEDMTEENEESLKDNWAVSEKDKYGAGQSLPSRYFMPDRSLICRMCNKTGHLSKSCYLQKKCLTCVLCGIRGHIQRACPDRPCFTCGRPSHGLQSCEIPPMWNQHCKRCGMTGHLSDTCPDVWRQYHLTITVEAPLRPRTVKNVQPRRFCAHCYNCAKRGHYGHECTLKRMISGTFPSLPYICHYDTKEDILQHCTQMQKRAKEFPNVGSQLFSDQGPLSEKTGDFAEEGISVQVRSRNKQDACSRAVRRKTWPEKRKQRREVKRLRREAQAIREGGLLGKLRYTCDDEVCPVNPFGDPLLGHTQSTTPLKNKRRAEVGGRKSRESEKWKKKRGVKRGEMYPHGNGDIDGEHLSSPKQRVRHRRR